MDGAPACPFVAFGDDRDGRSTSPDHRHRCFAESPPAPRARRAPGGVLPVERVPRLPDVPGLGPSRGRPRARCRRARRDGADRRCGSGAAATATRWTTTIAHRRRCGGRPAETPRRPAEPPVERNPPRDWAAPPPWATAERPGSSRASAGRPSDAGAGPAGRPGSRGPGSGRAAPRTGWPAARSRPRPRGRPAPAWSASARRSHGIRPRTTTSAGLGPAEGRRGAAIPAADRSPSRRRPARDAAGRSARRVRPATRIPRPALGADARATRPTRRSRRAPVAGHARPAADRVLAGALGIAALALFMLPALLGIGGGGGSAQSGPERQPAGRHGQAVADVAARADAAGLRDQGGRHLAQDRQEVRRHARRAPGRQPDDQGPEQDLARPARSSSRSRPRLRPQRHPDPPRRRLERLASRGVPRRAWRGPSEARC